MGYYVNPEHGTKESWLAENGRMIPGIATPTPGHHLVCLVDNGYFTAAAIGYDEREAEAFNSPTDDRPKVWFEVPDDKLLEVCPDVPLT